MLRSSNTVEGQLILGRSGSVLGTSLYSKLGNGPFGFMKHLQTIWTEWTECVGLLGANLYIVCLIEEFVFLTTHRVG